MADINRNYTARDVSALSSNRSKALNALLATTSIAAAAEQCGLSVSTVKKYLREEPFKRVYKEQRRLVLEETVAGITRLGTKAVAVIEATIDSSGDPNAKLRAARTALDYIAKFVELERKIIETSELEERLTALEMERQASRNGSGRGL